MIVVDLIILIPYTVVEALDGSVETEVNVENPYESDKVCM